MPKIYSDTEKKNIRDALRREAGKCLHQYGVRKTTVDELVRRVAIPKGTFYLFYPSKEALFFDLLESFYSETEETYPEMLQEIDENHIVTSLTDIFYTIIMRFYHAGLYWFLDGAELELVLRRLPEGTMERITKIESNVIHELFSYFAIEDEDQSLSWNEGYSSPRYGRSAGFRSSAGYGGRYGSSSGYGCAGSYGGSTGFARAKMDPAVKKMAAKAEFKGFSIGNRVRHARFGDGSVVGLTGLGDDARIRVQFDDVGTKELLLSLAKLTKL